MSTFNGKGGMLYLQGSGTEAVKVAECREWSIETDYSLDEDNAMGDTYESYTRGLNKASGKIDFNLDDADNNLWEAANQDTSRKCYFYPKSGVTGAYYYALVYPKISVSVGLGGTARGSMTFQTDGAITRKP